VEWDKCAWDSIVYNSGFNYEYSLVGYTEGGNNTSESVHAAITQLTDENGKVYNAIRPQLPTAAGEGADFGATAQNKATVGRRPIVRVLLRDTKNDKVAAIGFIKFDIAATAPTPVVPVYTAIEFPKQTKDFTVLCSDPVVLTQKLTWAQMENLILAGEPFEKYTGMSNAIFEANYTLDMSGANVKQYSNTEGATATESTAYFGTITVTNEVVDAITTNVLTWTVYNDEAYTRFKDGNKTPQVVYVRYTKTGTVSGPDYVFAKFEWAPANTNVKPSASIENDDKISNYWYMNYSNEHGYEAIRGNVEVVGQTGANDEFIFNVLNTFTGNTITLHGLDAVYRPTDATYGPYALTTNPAFQFVTPDPAEVKGNDGKTYVLEVNADNVTLEAYDKADATKTKQVIAVINQLGANNWSVFYGSATGTPAAASAYSKAILNYAGHKDLAKGQTFTGKMAVNVNTCAPVNTIPVDNNQFFVKFLRPITVLDRTTDKFIDAQTGGSEVKVNLNIIDWRDIKFADMDHATLRGGQNFFTYYDVQAVNVDVNPNNVTTNMGQADGSFKKLSDVTSQLSLAYTAPTLAELTATPTATNQLRYGTLRYQNTGLNVGDFDLKFPGTLTYAWGTVKFTVTVHVDYTIANVKGN